MSRTEQIEELLSDVLPRLEALKDEALEEIAEAKNEAFAKTKRHEQATRELATTEAEISHLSTEREELPDRAYRAGLEERYEEEDRLKERYRNLRLAIESLEDRRGSLKTELYLSRGHNPKEVRASAYAEAATVAHDRRREVEDLKERLTKALDDAEGSVSREHEALKGTVEWLGQAERWEESPVGRGALRI